VKQGLEPILRVGSKKEEIIKIVGSGKCLKEVSGAENY
jgi:hypothetical protein